MLNEVNIIVRLCKFMGRFSHSGTVIDYSEGGLKWEGRVSFIPTKRVWKNWGRGEEKTQPSFHSLKVDVGVQS